MEQEQTHSREILELEIRHLNEMIGDLSQKIAVLSVDLSHATTFGKRMEQNAQNYKHQVEELKQKVSLLESQSDPSEDDK